MSEQEPYNVLFLCTGNSARSIFGEVLLNQMGNGRFRGFSAGSDPRGAVHPIALMYLEMTGFDTTTLRSKTWDEFHGPGAPDFDFVFTVCDNAASEPCPVWPGQPITAHWGIEDPVALDPGDSAPDDARLKPYKTAFALLRRRIQLLMNLPISSLDRMKLEHEVREIGMQSDDGPKEPE